jgi:hypothetical protein
MLVYHLRVKAILIARNTKRPADIRLNQRAALALPASSLANRPENIATAMLIRVPPTLNTMPKIKS